MPTSQGVSTCPTCRARIRWAITASGKRQAVNADPDEAGNLACYTDGTSTLRARVLTKDRPTLEHLEWRAMPHAATCTVPPRPTPRPRPAAVRYSGRPVLRVIHGQRGGAR